MADDSGLERTEPASPQRLEKAREEGDVPRSRELSTCTVLLAAGGGLFFYGDTLFRQLGKSLTTGVSFERAVAFDSTFLLTRAQNMIEEVMFAFMPVAALLLIAALASPLLIGGWLFSFKALEPKMSLLIHIAFMGSSVFSRASIELV